MIKSIFQLLMCFFTFLTTANLRFSDMMLKKLHYIIYFIIIFNVAMFITSGQNIGQIKLIYSHPNFLGAYLFVLTPLLLFYYNRNNRAIIISIVIFILYFIYATGARSSLLALCIMLLLVVIPTISLKKYISYTIMALTALFTYIYLYIAHTELGRALNVVSQQYFHKNLFSGRQIIWNNILDLICQKPIFGYGISENSFSVLNMGLSAHNWYLQITFQTGIFGLSIILLIIMYIYHEYIYRNMIFQYSVLAAFVPAFLFQELFEVMLTQNHLAIGLIVWFILGMGCNRSLYHKIITKANLYHKVTL